MNEMKMCYGTGHYPRNFRYIPNIVSYWPIWGNTSYYWVWIMVYDRDVCQDV